jgi:hypothetical protein
MGGLGATPAIPWEALAGQRRSLSNAQLKRNSSTRPTQIQNPNPDSQSFNRISGITTRLVKWSCGW